jgi:uncharacterized protein (TIGR03435 family)
MKILLATLLLSTSCFAQTVFPDTGKPAPELQLQQLLQAPSGMAPKLEALRGKAVVLEFWATWCGGCVAAIPHLNDLADQFKDKAVFISVSDEEPATVEAFLKLKSIHGLVGVDKNGGTFQTYGVDGRPAAFLIDASGVLQGPVNSSQLDAPLLEKLIAGKALGDAVVTKPVMPVLERQPGAPAPLLQCIIRPAVPRSTALYPSGAYIAAEGGRFEEYGVTVKRILGEKERLREDRIAGPEWISQSRYDTSTVVPRGWTYETRDSLMLDMLRLTFQMKSHREQRPASVYVLGKTSATADKLKAATGESKTAFRPEPGHLSGGPSDISDLMRRLELGGVEVIDETGLTGVYDFDLTWKTGDIASLTSALHDQLGLTLTKETRQREFLVIDSAVEPTTW